MTVNAEHPPAGLTTPELQRITAAAHAAQQRYPGPVGDVVARELYLWADMGWRFGGGSRIAALVDDLLTHPAPHPAPPAVAAPAEPARTLVKRFAARLRRHH